MLKAAHETLIQARVKSSSFETAKITSLISLDLLKSRQWAFILIFLVLKNVRNVLI